MIPAARWLHPLSLRLSTQIVTLVVTMAVVIASVTAVSILWQVERTWIARETADQASLAFLIAQTAGAQLGDVRREVEQAATRGSVLRAMDQEPWNVDELDRAVHRSADQFPLLARAEILDLAGTAWAPLGAQGAAWPGPSPADAEYIAGALHTDTPGGSFVSAPFRDARTGKPVVAVSAAIFGADGKPRGVFVGYVDTDRLSQLLGRAGLSGREDVAVVAPSGLVAAHTRAERVLGTVASESAFGAAALRGERGAATERPSTGGPDVLVGYAPLAGHGWGVLVKAQSSDILI